MKETKDAMEFVLRFAEATDKALEDGKFSFMDLPSYIPVMTLLNDAIDGAKSIPAELKAMTEEDKKQLHDVIETLNLRNPDYDAIAEESLKVATSVVKLVGMIRDARKK